jgi:hypothetical protein
MLEEFKRAAAIARGNAFEAGDGTFSIRRFRLLLPKLLANSRGEMHRHARYHHFVKIGIQSSANFFQSHLVCFQFMLCTNGLHLP